MRSTGPFNHGSWVVRRDLIDLSPKQVAQLAKLVREDFGDEAANV